MPTMNRPTLRDWMLFAPLYIIREADERSVELDVDGQVLNLLQQQGYVTREIFADDARAGDRVELVRITKEGRVALNAFLDAVGISRRELRAAARRAAREFGRSQRQQ